jgi:hypothetical protein
VLKGDYDEKNIYGFGIIFDNGYASPVVDGL